MIESYRNYWKQYFNIKGRLKRSHFWFALLFNLIITCVLTTLLFLATDIPMIATVLMMYFLFAFINIVPTFTAMVRRIHDTGRHAYLFILYVLYFMFMLIFYRFMFDIGGLILIIIFGFLTIYFLIVFLLPTRYELIDRRKFF